MKRVKVMSQLCKMGEHGCCEPRWTEDDEHGLPVIACACNCACHGGAKPEQIERLRKVMAEARAEAQKASE